MKEPPKPGTHTLTARQLAARWGVSMDYLRQLRARQKGPPWWRVTDRRVIYPADGVLEYERRK